MNVELILLFLAFGVVQTFFYCRQLKTMNALFVDLRRRGHVLVGRKKTVLRGGAIVLLRLSDQFIIEEAYLIKGYTAFARTIPFNEVVGKSTQEIPAIGTGIIQDALRDVAERFRQNTSHSNRTG